MICLLLYFLANLSLSFAVKSIFCARYQDFYSNKFLSNQTIIYPFKKIFGFGSTKQMDNSNLVAHYLEWIHTIGRLLGDLNVGLAPYVVGSRFTSLLVQFQALPGPGCSEEAILHSYSYWKCRPEPSPAWFKRANSWARQSLLAWPVVHRYL